MSSLRLTLLCFLYLTLGSYAVPAMRVGSELSLPFAVILVAALTFVVALEYCAARRPLRLPRWVVWSICGYATSIGLSWATAVELDHARSLKNLLFVFSVVAVVLAVRDHRTLRLATICLGLSSLAVFTYGAYGYFTESVGDPIQHSFGYFGVTYMESTRNSDVMYFQTAFWFLASLALFGRDVRLRWVWAALAGVVAAGLALSLARGTWISTSITLAIVLSRAGFVRLRRISPVGLSVAAAGVAVVGVILLVELEPHDVLGRGSDRFAPVVEAIERLQSRFDTITSMSDSDAVSSNRVRLELGLRSLQLAWTHPLGVGVGNGKFYLGDIGLSGLNHVENEYLQLIVEQSLLGLIAFLLLLGYVVTGGLRHAGAPLLDGSRDWCGWALVGICVDWSIYGMFNLLHDSTWFWLVVALAAAWVRTKASESSAATMPSDSGVRAPLVLGATLHPTRRP